MASKAWAIESVVAGRYDEDIVNALNNTRTADVDYSDDVFLFYRRLF